MALPNGYSWMLIGEPPTQLMRCYASTRRTQFITNDLLLKTDDRAVFHDHQLADLTDRVNKLFAKAEALAPDGRELAMLSVPDGFLLAWTENFHHEDWPDELPAGAVHYDSGVAAVRKALRYQPVG